jgi:FkbM family methyltransferase
MPTTEMMAAWPGIDLNTSRLRECRHGLMFYLAADTTIGQALDVYGEFADSENELMTEIVKPGDVVLDVGANIGTVTLPLARRLGPSGLVIAFEPQRIIFQHLCANIALNGLTHVDARRAAVGAAAGSISVPSVSAATSTNFGAVTLLGNTEGEPVPLIAIDDLNLERCALIKIDVEGMEGDVLRGAERTIARARPAVYFEAKRTAATSACLAWLAERDYRLFWHFAAFFRKSNFRGVARDIFANRGDINALPCLLTLRCGPICRR